MARNVTRMASLGHTNGKSGKDIRILEVRRLKEEQEPINDSVVLAYHGTDAALQGKVLRLAKEVAIQRHQDTLAGHPATAYNNFVSTMLVDYLGVPAFNNQVMS